MIGKGKRDCASSSHTVVEKGGKREREKECVVARGTLLLCFGEERNNNLTLSCEGILVVEGYSHFKFYVK